MKNDILLLKLEDDAGVDDQDLVKSINQLPCHLVSYMLGHSKRLMNIAFRKIDKFTVTTFTTKIRTVTIIMKNMWSTLVE